MGATEVDMIRYHSRIRNTKLKDIKEEGEGEEGKSIYLETSNEDIDSFAN